MSTPEADHVARPVAGADPQGRTLPYWMAVCTCGWDWWPNRSQPRKAEAVSRADAHWLAEHAGIGVS